MDEKQPTSRTEGRISKIEVQANGKYQSYVDGQKCGPPVDSEAAAKMQIERVLRGEIKLDAPRPEVRRRQERKDA
jgi:hypothetical protein